MNAYLKSFLITVCVFLTALSTLGALYLYSSVRHDELVAKELTVDKTVLEAGDLFELKFSLELPFELSKADLKLSSADEDVIYLAKTLKLESESVALHSIVRDYSFRAQSLKESGGFRAQFNGSISNKVFSFTSPELKVSGYADLTEKLNTTELVLTEKEITETTIDKTGEQESFPWLKLLAGLLLLAAILIFVIPRLRKGKPYWQAIEAELKLLQADKNVENRAGRSLDLLFDYLSQRTTLKVCSQTSVEALPSLKSKLSESDFDHLKGLCQSSDELKFNPFSKEDEEALLIKTYELFESLKSAELASLSGRKS